MYDGEIIFGRPISEPLSTSWDGYVDVSGDNCQHSLYIAIGVKMVSLKIEVVADGDIDFSEDFFNNIIESGDSKWNFISCPIDFNYTKGRTALISTFCGAEASAEVKFSKRYTFKEFTTGANYYSPAQNEYNEKEGNVTLKFNQLCDDKTIRLVLTDHLDADDKFYLLSISLNTNPEDKNEMIEYNVLEHDPEGDLLSDLENGNDKWQLAKWIFGSFPGGDLPNKNASVIDFNFNKSVDKTSIENKSSIAVHEANDRANVCDMNLYCLEIKGIWGFYHTVSKGYSPNEYKGCQSYAFINDDYSLRMSNEYFTGGMCFKDKDSNTWCWKNYIYGCQNAAGYFQVRNNNDYQVKDVGGLALSNPVQIENQNGLKKISFFNEMLELKYSVDMVSINDDNEDGQHSEIAGIIFAAKYRISDNQMIDLKCFTKSFGPQSVYRYNFEEFKSVDFRDLFTYQPVYGDEQLDMGLLFYDMEDEEGGTIFNNADDILVKAINEYSNNYEHERKIGNMLFMILKEEYNYIYPNESNTDEDQLLGFTPNYFKYESDEGLNSYLTFSNSWGFYKYLDNKRILPVLGINGNIKYNIKVESSEFQKLDRGYIKK